MYRLESRQISMDVTPREIVEYRALRDTVRERGTQRLWVALIGFLAWAACACAGLAFAALPVQTLLPLFVLAISFEIVFSIHTAVERIGRYIQVFFEEGSAGAIEHGRGWEQQAMAYGLRFPGTGPDPLLAGYYVAAAFLNFMPVGLAGGLLVEYIGLGAVHVLFVARVIMARRRAACQRSLDLERFRQLKRSTAAS